MVKRIALLALVALALAVVPAALADNGPTPTQPTAPAASSAGATQNGNAGARARLRRIHLRLERARRRFVRHCGTSSDGSSQRCVQFANNVLTRLQKLDAGVQKRIATIQQRCGTTATSGDSGSASSSTTTPVKDPCANADRRIARLQKLDARIQAAIAKVQGWLNGQPASSGSSTSDSSTSDSSLDQASQALSQLADQVASG
jgi:hypothetical protein